MCRKNKMGSQTGNEKKSCKISRMPFLWIDFLGFREFILNEPEKLDQMPDFLFNSVLPSQILNQNGVFQYILLSDTLVLCPGNKRSYDDDIAQQLIDIAKIAHYMLGKSIRNRIPIRGTLTYGDITFKTAEGQSMALGTGVIDAYLLEKEQNWIGIVVSPESLRLLRSTYNNINIEKICGNMLVMYDKIPIQKLGMSIMTGYAVRPDGDINELKNSLQTKMLESAIGSQIKYQHTIAFLEEIEKRCKV